MRTPSPRRLIGGALVLLLVFLAFVVAGLSGGSGSESMSGSGAGDAAQSPEQPQPAEGRQARDFDASRNAATRDESSNSEVATESSFDDGVDVVDATSLTAAPDRKLISNGNVALQSDDVSQTVFDVVKVSDRYAGEVESKESQTDKEGEVVRSRMVLRIPTNDFIEAMDDLSATARLLSNSSNTQDVTTEVLDKDIRIRLQRRSIERIELLLDRAQNIRDIVSIEGQLSRRQADLATLEQKQRYLADQTAMSTVVVSVEKTPKKGPGRPSDPDQAGFFSGLAAGWSALKELVVTVATVTGALLPFALLIGLVGFPLWLLVRRSRRSRLATGSQANG